MKNILIWPHKLSPAVCRLFDVLKASGITARFVGGFVREAILGRVAKDIDIAVDVDPNALLQALKNANIKSIPTGVDHGTITAVIGSQTFEITSLRQDIETDGRHAIVRFGTDWLEDAKRRDFTMNAVYSDLEGNLFDPFNGREDLQDGCIRFIGNANKRIQEDYLRILRFYRFYAHFGKGTIDKKGQNACIKNRAGLNKVAIERIQNEFFKLLSADNPIPAITAMQEAGICQTVWQRNGNLEHLQKLIQIEGPYKNVLCRFHVWIGGNDEFYESQFRFSRQQLETLKKYNEFAVDSRLRGNDEEETGKDEVGLNEIAYRHGAALAIDIAHLRALEGQTLTLNEFEHYQRPIFPITAQDIMHLGIPPGPKLGNILRSCEQWWIDHFFQPTKNECLKFIKQGPR